MEDVYKEVQSLFSEIVHYEHVPESDIKSDVAVLYDYENIWSLALSAAK